MTGRGKIKDRKPPEAQAHGRPRVVVVAEGPLLVALVIRTAMDHRPHHAADRALNRSGLDTDHAADATHDREILLKKGGVL